MQILNKSSQAPLSLKEFDFSPFSHNTSGTNQDHMPSESQFFLNFYFYSKVNLHNQSSVQENTTTILCIELRSLRVPLLL